MLLQAKRTSSTIITGKRSFPTFSFSSRRSLIKIEEEPPSDWSSEFHPFFQLNSSPLFFVLNVFVCHFTSENPEKYLGGRVTQIGTMAISIISVYYFALIGLNGSLKRKELHRDIEMAEKYSLWYESELAKHSHSICLSHRMLSKVRRNVFNIFRFQTLV